MRSRLWLGQCAMLAAALPAAGGVFGLIPSPGNVNGLPGTATGWGYALVNATSNYFVVANSYFCESGQDPLFTTCTQSLGTYSDFVAAAATIVAPNTTGAGTFSARSAQGVGQYAINSTARIGQADSGNIVVVYDVFSANPFTSPSATQIGGDVEVTAPAVVTVGGATVPALSPAAMAVLAVILMACAWWAMRRETAEVEQ